MTVLTVDIPFVGAIEWSSETQLTTHPKNDMTPAIMQADNGTIWVVWASDRMGFGNEELYYKTSSNYGLNWTRDERLTQNQSHDLTPSIMQTSNGTIWVVWDSDRTGNYELFYKTSSDYGLSWSNDTQLTDDPDSDMRPSIVQARDATIWVVWQSGRPAGAQDELYYNTFNGSAWFSDTRLTNDQANDRTPSIAQIDDRKIWVVWTADRDEDFDIYYKNSSEIINHDVAITNVTPSVSRANPGETVSVSVVVENQGDTNETFDVNCYANTTTIESTTVTLTNGNSTTLIFSWNTTGVDKGNYTIRAEASVVSDEIDIVDNTCIHGMVMVTIPGDVNGDGTVDITDLALVNKVYGKVEGNPDYNPYTDLNRDGVMDIYDLAECGKNYGETEG